MRALGFGVAGLVVGAGVVGYLAFQGLLHVGPLQVSGDPPITVSDGSLHAHSKNDWVMPDPDGGLTIQPLPANAVLRKSDASTCNIQSSWGEFLYAALWTDDDKTTPIEPGSMITIVHDPGDTADGTDASGYVTIAVPQANQGPLQIKSAYDGFLPVNHGKNGFGRSNRQHVRPGEVKSITITYNGRTTTWPPAGYKSKNPHFTLEFCYQ
jgi:hypothetical protein